MKPIINVNNFKKSYGNVQAVKGVDFIVQKGELFAFLGPNGAGKSTTIDTLCTLNQFESGEINIAGFDLKKEQNEIRNCIGVVFQDNLLDKVLTVKENLMIRAGFYYKSKDKIRNVVEQAAINADVTDFISRPYGKLSGGQRRRADIARALLNTPEILFLDEPTTGLDPQTRRHVWETILKLQKEADMTIFLTTHYMEEAAESDHIVVIDGGKIVAKGTPYELKERYSFEHLKLVGKSNQDTEQLLEYLENQNLSWKRQGEVLDVVLSNTLQAIDILNSVREQLVSFEVIQGTLDDVFLNITGKEIRE